MSKKENSINKEVKKMMQRVNYVINETPIYRQIKEDDFANDDTIPVTQVKQANLLKDDDKNIIEDDINTTGKTPTTITTPESPDINQPEEESVDKIQNDIIKHNIVAIHGIHDKLSELENYVKNLNDTVINLSKDVDEVKEPTTTEKLMSKKDVSYPFYYNLNDYWKGSAFEAQREIANQKGIKKLPDGTFIADFDDLPKYSNNDLNDAFYDRNTFVY